MEEVSVSSADNNTAGKTKFIIGGLFIVAAIAYLIISSTQATAQYFLTVGELSEKDSSTIGRNLRVSGAVVGDTIEYDSQSLTLSFEIAHVPGDNKEIEAQGGLGAVLHEAVINSELPRLNVIYEGVKPDLLRNEAQAIMTGHLEEDGTFFADELLLKCPTKYEESVPEQAEN